MCVRKKGKGYDPAEVVTEAVKKSGWTPEKFFDCAKAFAGKNNGFNAMEAAEEFRAILMNRAAVVAHLISPTAVAFADWVLIKDARVIQERFHSY